jgi:mono/diheme cytochrome c family protein
MKEGIMSEAKKLAVGALGAILFVASLLISVAAQGEVQASDPAAFFKTKCVACHGQKAEKKFDATIPEEQLIDIVMKGNKPEKPPNMPAYGEKGVTAEQAKCLVEYMKGLKANP